MIVDELDPFPSDNPFEAARFAMLGSESIVWIEKEQTGNKMSVNYKPLWFAKYTKQKK